MGKKGKTGIIVFVSNSSWGILFFRSGLIREFLSHGFIVKVLAPEDHYTRELINAGVAFEALNLSPCGKNPLKELNSFLQLYRLYRRIQPDLILHYTIKPNIYGSLAAYLAGIPSIAVVTGLGRLATFSGRLRPWLSKLYAWGLLFSREVWFLNDRDEAAFLEAGLLRAGKSFVLPGEGVDTNYFSPRDRVSSGAKEGLSFLFAGRLLWDKGLGELASAAKNLKLDFPELRIFLIGFVCPDHPAGVPMKQIRRWEKQGIFRYLGETRDVRPYLNRTDCLVFPSYREGMSRIIMEAASMEVPVITTSRTGCADLVEDGENGLLCEAGDPASLEAAMRRFMNLSPEQRLEMGKLGRIRMQTTVDEHKIIRVCMQRLEPYLRPVFAGVLQLNLNSGS